MKNSGQSLIEACLFSLIAIGIITGIIHIFTLTAFRMHLRREAYESMLCSNSLGANSNCISQAKQRLQIWQSLGFQIKSWQIKEHHKNISIQADGIGPWKQIWRLSDELPNS